MTVNLQREPVHREPLYCESLYREPGYREPVYREPFIVNIYREPAGYLLGFRFKMNSKLIVTWMKQNEKWHDGALQGEQNETKQ